MNFSGSNFENKIFDMLLFLNAFDMPSFPFEDIEM